MTSPPARGPRPSPGSLLPVRAAVVLLGALVIGVIAASLGYLAHRNVPTALLIGGGALGGALALFHTLLGA
jgi:hypothetical protein